MSPPRGFRIHLGIVFLSAFLPYAASQQGGTGESAGNTGDPGRRVAPQSPQFFPVQFSGQSSQPISSPRFISGTVVREDGSPPPFGAVIEMNCNGLISREAVVGNNGRFEFQVGGPIVPDASRGFDRADSGSAKRLLGCELQATLNGFGSSSVRLKQEPGPGPNEIGTIVLYPYARVQGSSVSLTTLMAPKPAAKLFGQAQKAIRKEQLGEAEKDLRSAVGEYPKYAEAWFLLGEVCEAGGRKAEAVNLYEDSINADPKYVSPYVRLAKLAALDKRWREAADFSEKVLSLDPSALLESYFVSAIAHLNLNEMDLAEKRALEGQRMDFSHRYPQLYLVMASVFTLKHDLINAEQELSDYLKIVPDAADAAAVRAHLHQMESQTQPTEHE